MVFQPEPQPWVRQGESSARQGQQIPFQRTRSSLILLIRQPWGSGWTLKGEPVAIGNSPENRAPMLHDSGVYPLFWGLCPIIGTLSRSAAQHQLSLALERHQIIRKVLLPCIKHQEHCFNTQLKRSF
jgi:hypothetical protein